MPGTISSRARILLGAAIPMLLLRPGATAQVVKINPSLPGSENETTIALNPIDPTNLIAGSNFRGGDPPTESVVAYRSTNRGSTWTRFVMPKGGNYDRSVDPGVAFDRLGQAWFVHLSIDYPVPMAPGDDPANGIFVNRSTDGGSSWLAIPYAVTQNGDPDATGGTTVRDDRPAIACDGVPNSPYLHSVYAVWMRGEAGEPDVHVYLSRRDPGLGEFLPPVQVSTAGNAKSPTLAIGAGGRVVVGWYDSSGARIVVRTSSNGGESFGEERVVATNVADGIHINGARAWTYPSIATDALGGRFPGHAYIVWHEINPASPMNNRVMFCRSSDDGDSWEPPFSLDQMPNRHRWFPWVTTAPNGVVHVVYYSKLQSGGVVVTLATSYDGGSEATFGSRQASSGTIAYGSGTSPFMGDYIGVAAGMDRVYPTWCATTENQEDVYVALVDEAAVSVEVRQQDEQGTTLGSLQQWNGYDFGESFPPASTRQFRLYSQEVLRADTNLINQNKFHRWQVGPYECLLNHSRFDVMSDFPGVVTAYFGRSADASAFARLLDGPWYGGHVFLSDPWLRDHVDVLGVLNRGLDAVVHTVISGSNNLGLSSAYRGVFLSQNPNWLPGIPYYTVGAPDSQSIGGLTGYFQRWSGNGARFLDSLAGETPVVFTAAGAMATALYKAHLRSGSASALHSNSQRKVMRDSVGCYHMVYESAGHIWHVRSSNEGVTWSRERRLSQEGSIPVTYSSASLTVLPESRQVAAVWEWRDTSTTCVQLALLDDRTGEPVSIRDVAIYDVAQNAGTMPVAGVARYQSSPYLLVAWYDASSETVQGRVMDPGGNLGIETELLAHPVSSISLTPTAEDDRWGLTSSDGSTVRWREFHAPQAAGEMEETVAWGSEDLQQRYPSVGFGEGPSIDPGVAWEEYGWEIDRRVVKYREREKDAWQPVVVFADNTSHPDYHSPSMTANEFTQTVTIAWRSGAEELRSVSRDWRGEWSEQTVLPVTGSDPALSLGRAPTAGDREFLAYRGISPLYSIAGTMVQPPGGGDEESPTAGGGEYQREGRGVSVVFPSGSLRLALLEVAFNGRGVGFGRFPDSVEIRTAERVETTLQSEPLTGTGALECTLLSQTTGEVPAAGEIRLVLRDGGIVATILRSFRSGADSVQRVRIPLSLGSKVRRIGVQFWGLGTVETVEPERWIVGGSGGDVNLAQKPLLRPEETPAEFRLHPSYPNPFNPSTEIRYELPEPARVSLVIYDVLGRVVVTLVDEEKNAGYHTVQWNALGRSSGVYLARFTATTATGNTVLQQTMKLVLTK